MLETVKPLMPTWHKYEILSLKNSITITLEQLAFIKMYDINVLMVGRRKNLS